AGLYDPAAPGAADRLALLEFLTEQGCDLAEMLEADAIDRLFAVAGDRMIRPPRPRYDANGAADLLGVDPAAVSRAWRSFGLPAPTEPVLGEQDVEAVRTWLLVRDLLGEEAATGLGRVLGAGTSRLAEAEAAALRLLGGAVDRAESGEAAAARTYADVTTLVPRIGNVLDAVHRHHIEAARRHFELVAPTRDTVRCGIGFADLTGFTALSQAKPLPELAMLLAAFEDASSTTVHDGGGRVVKFLGDAVMWVSPTATGLARVAHRLVTHPRAQEAALQVRAGIAYGDVLAQDGDYFGPPVNLAARLVATAAPGQVLASPATVPLLGPDVCATELEPRELRGLDAPVTPFLLSPV
ncbi:MAG: adenylate/guanylate cyclase domain-containing protein, partial [Actinobacteria bacterium]|nr:adenylate/guanylate cyclase domain-containing protein [Actinomycetota bacterium]